MALTSAIKNAMLTAQIATTSNVAAYASLHTADPGATGASEVSGAGYARQAVSWGSPATGSVSATALAFTIPSGVNATYIGYWTAITSGTWCFSALLSAPQGAGTTSITPTETVTG